jgi:DNA-binding MarR family transcriptional regulator
MATDERDASAVEVWSAIVAAYQSVLHDLVAALDDEAAMDSGVFSALAYLERATPPHRLPMAALQRMMHPRYSQPGFSRLVSRMEEGGLVRRTADPEDRRAVVLVSTSTGRARYRRADGVYRATVRERMSPLSAAQCRAMAALLGPVGAPGASAEAAEG